MTLASFLYSNPSKVAETEYALEIARLQKINDQTGMEALVGAHKHFINARSQHNSKQLNDQFALRTLDWLSYMADLILQGKNPEESKQIICVERRHTSQHLWPTGAARKFYHQATKYTPPFGATGLNTIIDNSLYSLPLDYTEEKERVWLLLGRFTLSEDHAIQYLRNKIVELEAIADHAVHAAQVKEDKRDIVLDGLTRLEGELLTLPETTRQKLAGGYEDCIKLIRRNTEIPKEAAEYLSLKFSIVPKRIIEGSRPEARDSNWYDQALKHFALQNSAIVCREAIPFDLLAEQDPKVAFPNLEGEHGWLIHQAVVDAYSFFSKPENFARLPANQNLIPEELLLDSTHALHSYDQNPQNW